MNGAKKLELTRLTFLTMIEYLGSYYPSTSIYEIGRLNEINERFDNGDDLTFWDIDFVQDELKDAIDKKKIECTDIELFLFDNLNFYMV